MQATAPITDLNSIVAMARLQAAVQLHTVERQIALSTNEMQLLRDNLFTCLNVNEHQTLNRLDTPFPAMAENLADAVIDCHIIECITVRSLDDAGDCPPKH